MSGTESVAALIELLHSNPDLCNWTGGLSAQDIARAEERLEAEFSPSYRRFLAESGSCEAGSEEFLGIYRTSAKGDSLLGTVSETLDARTDARFPRDLLVIQYDGMGGLVSLDVSRKATRASRRSSSGTPAPLTAGVPNCSPMTSAPTSCVSAPEP
jgi:hypothetical protein